MDDEGGWVGGALVLSVAAKPGASDGIEFQSL